MVLRAQTPAPDAASSAVELASRPSLLTGLLDPMESPVILPQSDDADEPEQAPRPPRVMADGAIIVDHPGVPTRDLEGKWWTVEHPLTGTLRLLPCDLLESLEDAHAAAPEKTFLLSGQVYRYQGGYYLLLWRVLDPTDAPAAAAHPPQEPAEQPQPASAEAPPATSQPGQTGEATADDIARQLLDQFTGTPILPEARPDTPQTHVPSVAPTTRTPLLPGPGKMVINRLVRLRPPAEPGGWFTLSFEADSSLRDPPLPVLPSWQLEKIENLSNGGAAPGARFYVSGHLHYYRGRSYILLRSVHRRRDLDLF